ncbi:hypothetical protein HK097_000385 [Rhizophlyctis rosea]|uniref:Uncharacterized protein n=1 Tax=Rhizophlyctis rosea TaxID=64517 RepID=A0AAD5S8K8_9FUNG|nr:hypothetical protein HK097_000385 [Rhizophlyctis rosea]
MATKDQTASKRKRTLSEGQGRSQSKRSQQNMNLRESPDFIIDEGGPSGHQQPALRESSNRPQYFPDRSTKAFDLDLTIVGGNAGNSKRKGSEVRLAEVIPIPYARVYETLDHFVVIEFGQKGWQVAYVYRKEPWRVYIGPKPPINLSGGANKDLCVVLFNRQGKDAKIVAVGYEALAMARTPEARQCLVIGFKLALYGLNTEVPWTVDKTVEEVLADFIQNALKRATKLAGMIHVITISEPEAALYQALKLQMERGIKFCIGDTIVIIDFGSGTIDFGVYQLIELTAHKKWKAQLLRQRGIVGAGEKVDAEFLKMVKCRMGNAAFDEFASKSDALQDCSSALLVMKLFNDKIKPVWHDPKENIAISMLVPMETAMKKHGTWQQFLEDQQHEASLFVVSGADMSAICRSAFDPALEVYRNLAKEFHITFCFTVGGTVYMKYLQKRLGEDIKEFRPFLEPPGLSYLDMYCVEGGGLAASALDAIVARRLHVGILVAQYRYLTKPKNWQKPAERESDWEIDGEPDEYEDPTIKNRLWRKVVVPINVVGDHVFVTNYYQMSRPITPQSTEDSAAYVWPVITTETIREVTAWADLDRAQMTEPTKFLVPMGPEVRDREFKIKIEFRLGEIAMFAITKEGLVAGEMQPL